MLEDSPNPRDKLTTEIGLYHYGRSYHDSARALEKANVKTTHPQAPIWFLYFHSIELFLKTYLRLHGHTVADLEGKFRHDIKRMRKRAVALGFHFDDEDLAVLEFMEKTPIVIQSRYIVTGAKRVPTTEALERTATSLRDTVCTAVRKTTGVRVRA